MDRQYHCIRSVISDQTVRDQYKNLDLVTSVVEKGTSPEHEDVIVHCFESVFDRTSESIHDKDFVKDNFISDGIPPLCVDQEQRYSSQEFQKTNSPSISCDLKITHQIMKTIHSHTTLTDCCEINKCDTIDQRRSISETCNEHADKLVSYLVYSWESEAKENISPTNIFRVIQFDSPLLLDYADIAVISINSISIKTNIGTVLEDQKSKMSDRLIIRYCGEDIVRKYFHRSSLLLTADQKTLKGLRTIYPELRNVYVSFFYNSSKFTHNKVDAASRSEPPISITRKKTRKRRTKILHKMPENNGNDEVQNGKRKLTSKEASTSSTSPNKRTRIQQIPSKEPEIILKFRKELSEEQVDEANVIRNKIREMDSSIMDLQRKQRYDPIILTN